MRGMDAMPIETQVSEDLPRCLKHKCRMLKTEHPHEYECQVDKRVYVAKELSRTAEAVTYIVAGD